ncbi:homoserine dehydrogenase [Fuerstiella marisgermanici]|uniref:Homoserine dehydrogenase n=1 Tax=Fuerstiella marisgermanici TaxID=1891926 RepID=A0A1P8WK81_9PLAN|nr:homoserine dehydrogenase [Fuerstiella marisgermanici]APZ94462.1 Homoserine dehydrogenase [Fuerstiella marisgermanici]
MTSTSPLNIALIGFGTVGSGVARILSTQAKNIAVRAGREIRISRVVVRDPDKAREFLPAGVEVSTSIDDVIDDPQIQLVAQLIGGIDPAFDYMKRSLAAGKDVVTANKALIYAHGSELFERAAANERTIGFEAAVAGGIPIIGAVTQALTGNQILSLEAILNGTSNFILTRMLDEQHAYADALKEAQRLGYAEADPAMDVDGTDAAQKLAILTQLAFSTPVKLDDFVRQGIDGIELLDLQVAADLGYKIKLLATARLQNKRLEISVQPTLISCDRTIAQIDGADNIVAVHGDAVGNTTFSGAGAGQLPTASAVVADIIDYATGRTAVTFQSILRSSQQEPWPVQPAEELRRRYYLRLTVDDRPHVLADITDVLGRNEISISSVRQDETPETDEAGDGTARLVIMTHTTTEGRLRAADTELSKLACIRGASIRLPIAD